eukprot:CAMPEP_0170619824 /NCGR_PEP_ID=MMETSP0224-20130122/27723_1 /TAXON_ID=285029 /ORGANISM="Togula jolla, Strain CCCM 725" /LENGTH=186 /DNA_ID=CAMNT_0010945941 /DNA_START=184 /DNA_END=745 /DNA_ORIENTATION=-
MPAEARPAALCPSAGPSADGATDRDRESTQSTQSTQSTLLGRSSPKGCEFRELSEFCEFCEFRSAFVHRRHAENARRALPAPASRAKFTSRASRAQAFQARFRVPINAGYGGGDSVAQSHHDHMERRQQVAHSELRHAELRHAERRQRLPSSKNLKAGQEAHAGGHQGDPWQAVQMSHWVLAEGQP